MKDEQDKPKETPVEKAIAVIACAGICRIMEPLSELAAKSGLPYPVEGMQLSLTVPLGTARILERTYVHTGQIVQIFAGALGMGDMDFSCAVVDLGDGWARFAITNNTTKREQKGRVKP